MIFGGQSSLGPTRRRRLNNKIIPPLKYGIEITFHAYDVWISRVREGRMFESHKILL